MDACTCVSSDWPPRPYLANTTTAQQPTNHLDLEAVLWLQEYLKGYKHTVLLVSHDRAFLNEVGLCRCV